MNESRNPSNPRLRVLILNRSYWPDAEATGQLLTELCEDLSATCDVTVIAGQPNQNPEGADFVHRGWQLRNNVQIRRVWHTRFRKTSFAGRVLNMVSYLLAAFCAGLAVRRPDVIVVETDPPVLCLLGGLLKLWHRARLVVYLQDIYPDVAVALGKLSEGLLARLLRRLFVAIYRRADRVVVLSRDMRTWLLEQGVAAEKIACLSNWIDTHLVHPRKQANQFRTRYGLQNCFVAMYSGNMGLSQRLELVLDAAEKLKERADLRLVLIGDGASRTRLEKSAYDRGLDNVLFLDYQPKAELAESLSAADVHLVMLAPALTQLLMPSKIYGVWASGTASLVLAKPESELATLTQTHCTGRIVPPHDATALADALRWAAEHRQELA